MKNIYCFLNSYKTIVIINDSKYVGDSIIFFWPFVNMVVEAFSNKDIQVYHPHTNVFMPIQKKVYSDNLPAFYSKEFILKETIVIAFTLKRGRLKKFLQKNVIQSIVKDFGRLNFLMLNTPKQQVISDGFKCKSKSDLEHHYVSNIKAIHSDSGFTMLDKYFSNVYEYSKICNEKFLGFGSMNMAQTGNIIVHNFDLKNSIEEFIFPHTPFTMRKFIFINLICGTFKKDVLEKYDCLINFIKKISLQSKSLNIFILADSNFSSLKSDLTDSLENIFFLRENSNSCWNTLIKKAEKVYSIDTGFLHIAHILNKNTYGFGGDVDFWFFNDKIIMLDDFKNT
jgi:hypothetical protein